MFDNHSNSHCVRDQVLQNCVFFLLSYNIFHLAYLTCLLDHCRTSSRQAGELEDEWESLIGNAGEKDSLSEEMQSRTS